MMKPHQPDSEIPFEIPEAVCPSCGYKMEAATNATGKGTPAPGDISMCFGCTEVLTFNADMTQRALTPEEFLDLPFEVRRLLIRMRTVHAKVTKDRKPVTPPPAAESQ